MYSLAHPCFARKASQGKPISPSFSRFSVRSRRLSGTAYRRSPGRRLKNALVLRSQAEGAGEVAYPRISGGLGGQRFYSPGMGRWLSRDPIEERGGVNLYTFVKNRASELFDPTGLTILGTTYCDFTNGIPIITYNIEPDSCGVWQTVADHEFVHYNQTLSCCGKLAAKCAANPSLCFSYRQQYNNWLGANKDYFECWAYTASVVSIQNSMIDHKCKCTNEDGCCPILAQFLQGQQLMKAAYCSGSLTALPCPW